MAGRKSDFTLTKLDDLFSTQEQRDEENLSKIRDIPLTEIDDFPDHPFKVRDDEDMAQLIESIKERGVITPATVRQKEDGRYELISGHRRKRACELAGFDTLRCEVVDLNRDEATILMVESNYQRSQILPSEKAYAYKMRLEAMKRQAGRPSKENGVPLGHDSLVGKSRELLAAEGQDSNTQIQRYIRLTNLVPELLEYVDEGRIKMRPAVELSFLDEDSQRDVVDEIDLNDATPSHDQTIRMRKFFEELTTEELIKYDYIIQQAFKAGLTAATISVVLKVAPEIIKAIDYLMKNGEINAEQFKKIGFAAVSGGAEGFIRGSVSAAITASCKAGLLGEALKSVDPTIVGTVTVLTMNVIKNAFQVALGKKTRTQLSGELVRDMYISACSLIGGGISQAFIEVPVLGYMIGSFVGSIIGSFTYNIGYKAVVSFCVDSGFTMFGLVEQDYTLPKEIIEQMGIETFEYESFQYDTFEPEGFSFETFETDTFEPDTLDITFLRRGVIGVSKVGYVL